MKINARILLIILTVVAFVSFTSTIIYNSLANSFLQTQHSKTLLNSTNLFVFSFQLQIEKVDDDFQKIISSSENLDSLDIAGKEVDFIFTLIDNNIINQKKYKSKNYITSTGVTLNQFLSDNKNVILKYKNLNGETFYYGFIITDKLLTEISKKIQADISLIVDNKLLDVSNAKLNQSNYIYIENAYSLLKYKNNFDLSGEELQNTDFLASIYTPSNILTPSGRMSFLIFTVSREASEFRDTMRFIAFLIISVSIALSVIIVLIFTTKLRNQISLLSETAEITSKGNLNHRTKIILKDEIGKFGEAFNAMLDKLMAKEKAEKDYAEFITLLNKNPSLIEVSDQALAKIITSTGLTLGLLYLVENEQLRMVSSYGISDNVIKPSGEIEFYKNVIKKKEIAEFDFYKNNPVIKTGIAEIKIEYLLVAPVIYNKNVIAIIELASEKKPNINVKDYIGKIQEQLAVGLTNAKALEQLENFIEELRKLNEQYHLQNEQITEQNRQLLELHGKLKQNAEELEKQKEKAVELTKVKSDFLASMSHELRTPLNSILGLTELVIKDSSSSIKSKDRLNIVLRNGNKLLTLINNILEFSKIESGIVDLKIEEFSLKDFASDIFNFITPLVDEKKLSFFLSYNFANDKIIESDKSKIEQMVINLLGNAVKFTEQGEINLEFYSEGRDLEIVVRDTGIGIESNNLSVIFNEFKQLDSSISRNYGGTGLGLAICKRYINSLNGTINVESTPGEGSRFLLKIPDIIKENLANVKVKELSAVALTEDNRDAQFVLIVNSNKQVQNLIGDYLNTNNYGTKIFDSGNDALEFIKIETPSAIIMDVNIRDITPWEFVSKINKTGNFSNTPVLITSIDEIRKVGYGFSVLKYIIANGNFNLENIIPFSHNYKNILFFSEIKKVKKSDNDQSYDFIIDYSDLTNIASLEMYDLIIINIFANNFKGIDFYFELKKNRTTRKIPIIFELENKTHKDVSEKLIAKINELVARENHHPMDVLKVIRDRLKISSDPQNIFDLSHEGSKKEMSNDDRTGITSSALRKGKVLIVDDDNDTLFTVGEIVNDLGFETFFAKNGVECLLFLNNVVPDIVLLDIMMPQMDGFETIRRIRENEQLKNLTVIALTAYAMLDNKEVIEKNGFNDLITKPVKTVELKTKLKNYMNKLLRKINE
ncbi:MAG: response regulator [Bacteroidetes bacterium]|nr:response regulator [Bacteroidota bacterium]